MGLAVEPGSAYGLETRLPLLATSNGLATSADDGPMPMTFGWLLAVMSAVPPPAAIKLRVVTAIGLEMITSRRRPILLIWFGSLGPTGLVGLAGMLGSTGDRPARSCWPISRKLEDSE